MINFSNRSTLKMSIFDWNLRRTKSLIKQFCEEIWHEIQRHFLDFLGQNWQQMFKKVYISYQLIMDFRLIYKLQHINVKIKFRVFLVNLIHRIFSFHRKFSLNKTIDRIGPRESSNWTMIIPPEPTLSSFRKILSFKYLI